MKLSIHVITYNDEKNITRALDSALEQEFPYDYEIVIGDDCSTDRTREILIDFRDRYPDRIRLNLHEQNFGDSGKSNFVTTLKACRGEYVAMLPGDDYWITKDKLKKQVDFLDANPEFAACFHNVIREHETAAEATRLECPPDQKEVLELPDLLERNHIPTCSVVFRNNLFGEIPDWFYKGFSGDWFIHILNAQHGKIRYFDEVMAIYRITSEGAWSKLDPEQQVNHILNNYRLIDAHLNYEYHDACSRYMQEFKRSLSYIYLGKFHTLARSGHLREAARWLFKAISHDPNRVAQVRQFAYILKSCVLGTMGMMRRRPSSEAAR
jgi:glycosyltransferase involved in cell wall biosynthesis